MTRSKATGRILHLSALVLVAIAARLAMIQLADVTQDVRSAGSQPAPPQTIVTYRSGMTNDYRAPAYMLACGYGYNRPIFQTGKTHPWNAYKDVLKNRSLELAAQGDQLDETTRPPLPSHEIVPLYFRNPGYPVFLLAVYRVFGEPVDRIAEYVQAAITSLYPLLVFFIALKLFSRATVGYAAAWVTAVYPPLIAICLPALPSGLTIGLLLAAALAWIHAVQKPSYAWMLVAGLLIGLSCYFRSNGMFVWGALALATFICQKGWRRAAISSVILITAVYAVSAPWGWRNYRASGTWLWGSTGAGMTVWKSIGEDPKNPWGIDVDDEFTTQYAIEHGFESDYTPEANAWFMGLVKGYVKENPAFFIKATLKRLPLTIAPPYETGYRNPNLPVDPNTGRRQGILSYYGRKEGLTPFQTLWKYPGRILAGYWDRGLMMLLSLAGSVSMILLLFLRPYPWRSAVLLLAVPVYFVALHAPVLLLPRYMTIMIPFQMIALAAVIVAIVERVRIKSPAESPMNETVGNE